MTKIPKRPRDDFTKATVGTLSRRAGFRCSLPFCRKLTVGPGATPDASFSRGTAAHIISASPDSGPRADPAATREQRVSIDNGIWCCADHGRIIDADESRYTVTQLQDWKKNHEESILLEAGGCVFGRGAISSVTLSNIGRFIAPQTINFGSRTVLLGNNQTGKRLICDMIASVANFNNITEWHAKRLNKGSSRVRIEAFAGKKIRWDVSMSDDLICVADENPVPVVYSGFRVFHLSKGFYGMSVRRSDFGAGNMDDLAEDADWEAVDNKQFIDDLALFAGLPRDGLLTALKVLSLTPGRFFTELKMDGEKLLWRVNDSAGFYKFSQLGEGERQMVILDVFIRLSEFSAMFAPTILILNQHAFPSLDRVNLPRVIARLGELELNSQIVVALYSWASIKPDLVWRYWHLDNHKSDRGPVEIKPWVPPPAASTPTSLESVPSVAG
jgi:hypothetical protein